MAILSHFDSVRAKPGASFNAKSTYGFAGKLHTAIQHNFHGFGTLKNNTAAVEAINTQVLKNQHLIRTGGLSKYQAEKMIAKIHHEAAMKGEHLSATEKEALHKLGHHLTKQVIRRAPELQESERHGITSLSSTQHTSSVSSIGDQTRVTSGETPHASGGISNLIKNKNLPTMPNQTGSRPRPPNIKLSF
ncbi:MAG: hypothetical protein ACD_72C00420G0001 [uncultured bacterium]|nr:MAG: hypothetical protein ACD_72C00420G0001 [uncultured bacterium]